MTLSCLTTTKQSIHSGNYPTLKDVSTVSNLLYKFCKLMLRHHENLRKDVRSFTFASLLRYWRKIESPIQSEPSGKFMGKRKNYIIMCLMFRYVTLL